MLRLGYKASAEQFDPKTLLRYGILAEQLGFDSVFISDHLQPWRHSGGHAPFALSWLGALGASTERVVIGTSVLTPTLRYHPGVIAQAFATLGCLFPQRVDPRRRQRGIDERSAPRGRVAGPEGALRPAEGGGGADQGALARGPGDLRRNVLPHRNATIYDRPAQPVPLYIAASGPAAARLAGRVADGFICTSGKAEQLYAETLLPAVADGAAQAGRPVGALDMMIEMKVSYDTDRDRALADTRLWGALALTPEEKMGVDDPIEMERLADGLDVARSASRWLVSSDPDEHVAAIGRYVSLGFRHLVFHAPGTDQERFLRLYAGTCFPA